MNVVVHESSDAYCEQRGWTVVGHYNYRLEEYDWRCPVIVTGAKIGERRYYHEKFKLMKRGYTLLSSLYSDDGFADYQYEQKKGKPRVKRGGRLCFGFIRENGQEAADPVTMPVVQRIHELRNAGVKYKDIQADEKVCYPDGRSMSISTIQVILNNKERYKDYV